MHASSCQRWKSEFFGKMMISLVEFREPGQRGVRRYDRRCRLLAESSRFSAFGFLRRSESHRSHPFRLYLQRPQPRVSFVVFLIFEDSCAFSTRRHLLDGVLGTHASSNVSKTSLDVVALSSNALSSRFRAAARACVRASNFEVKSSQNRSGTRVFPE